MTVGVLLLAAGRGRRFGADKRLAVLADGRSLLLATIETIRCADLPLLVCLGTGDDELQARLSADGIPCQQCPDSALGMGSTLANGVAAVAASWGGALVALADMPLIRPRTYALVGDALGQAPGTGPGENSIAVPVYRGRRGHPVGFDGRHFPELLALGGDRGARDILAAHPGAVAEIEVDDPGVVVDVDRVEDLQQL